MCHKHGNMMPQQEQDQINNEGKLLDRFDPLGIFPGHNGYRYNHIEGFEFANNESHETLRIAMLHERKYPTIDNQAYCYRLIKDMINQYWEQEKIVHDERIKKAWAE